MSFRLRLGLAVGLGSLALVLGLLVAGWSSWKGSWQRARDAHLRLATRELAFELPQLLELTREALNRRVGELGLLAGARLTVVAADGTVLADSSVPFEHLPLVENHGTRPEVRAAFERGEGTARRRSATTDRFTRYLALRVASGNGTVVLRAAQEEGRVPFPWLVLVAGAAGASALGWLVSRAVGSRERQVWEHLTPWCNEAPDAEATVVAYEADRRFRELREATTRELAACRHALAQVSEGVVLLDRDKNVRFSNPAVEALLGKLPLGAPFWEACFNPQILELVGTETLARRHREVHHQGRTLSVTVAPLEHPVLAVALVVRDLTPQVRFEAARRALVADLAHELRTPLTVLAGVAEELASRNLAPELAPMLSRQVERLSRFAADLEELARIETGRLQLELAPVSLLPLAREVVAELLPFAQRQEVTVAVEGQDVTVVSDRFRLAQVLANLVDNAIRYNRPGGQVRVRVTPTERGARLEVDDTGLGIPESEIPLVFQRFYRVRREEGERAGSGLGLAIVKHLVARLGGQVSLTSTVGEGTRVWVELPSEPPKNGALPSP